MKQKEYIYKKKKYIFMEDKKVKNWKKRTKRKAPFYIFNEMEWTNKNSDGSYIKTYQVIWNEKEKTKFGMLKDKLQCVYGIETLCVLKGFSPLDLWNGNNINEKIFFEMLRVREGTSELEILEIDNLKDLR